MIISRAPYRISFFGGGTDYPQFYKKHGGDVLGCTINKFCYLNIRKLPPFFKHKHRIVYSKIENVNYIEEIQHPAVREVLKYLNIDYGVSIHHDGDIPARSGMGSSSAFTVALLKGLYALEGKYIDDLELAYKAIRVEQNLIKENVGSQDQVFSSHGGLAHIHFEKNGTVKVKPLILSSNRIKELQNSLFLGFTGVTRIASEIAKQQIQRTKLNISTLLKMKELVFQAINILNDESVSINEFGALLNNTWSLKKSLSAGIAPPFIDDIYNRAIRAGAIGGKLLGAGGGGFMLFFVPPNKRERLKKELRNILEIPFSFEFEGAKIVVYQPEGVKNYYGL